jgi:predicted permease
MRNKLRFVFRRDRFHRELAEEMDFHREMLEAEKAREGLDREAAVASASRQLGNTMLAGEYARDAWIISWLDTLLADVRYSLRTMAANKAFSGLAILSLALGIGANTAIFSFMDSILVRSLPVPDPESLVVLYWTAKDTRRDFVMKSMSGSTYSDPLSGVTAGIFPFPALEVFQRQDAVFSAVFAHCAAREVRRVNLAINGQAETATGWNVSGDYFRGLAIPPAAGRLIDSSDDRPGAEPVAVLSHAFGRKRFGDAPHAVGQPILIDNLPFTVVGVTPPGFFGVDPAAAPDFYLPMHANEVLGAGKQFGFQPGRFLDRNYYWIQVMGRLRPGVTVAQAQATLAPAFQQWAAASAANERERANLPALLVTEGAGGLDSLRRRYSQPLFVLVALVGLILALACANVANLLLARASTRRREMALRAAVGASRSRLVRQLLTESVLLAGMGGILGLLFAAWGIRVLTLLLANGRANFTLHAELNGHVLGAAAALSLVTGVLFGLAPALHATRVNLIPGLKAARDGREAFRVVRRIGLTHLLVASQIAISLLMLAAAGLFVRTLSNLESVALGFNRDNVLLFQLDARKAGHKDPEIAAFYRDLRNRFGAIPGVRDASLSEDSLIGAGTGLPISVSGAPPGPGSSILSVGPAFFRTMQIRILAGREFEESDQPGSPAVAVVNEAFAKAALAGRYPLGQHLILWDNGRAARDMEIIGVAGNARYGGLTNDIPPVVYMPYDQGYPRPDQMVYALRTVGDPLRHVASVREIVRRADPRVPVSDVRTQAADIDQAINQEITFARLCSAFALLALVIACVGLYGSVSYTVARRTGEIGIRLALGAQAAGVVRMVMSEVLLLVAVGLAVGLAMALGTSRFVGSFLYGMKPNDPLTLSLAVLTLLGAALVASYAPARRASRIDPMIALRQD